MDISFQSNARNPNLHSHPLESARESRTVGAPGAPPTRSQCILLLLSVFGFFLAGYLLTAPGETRSTGDTTIRIEVAQNLLWRGTPDLHGWFLSYPRHLKKEYYDPRIAVGSDGKTYSTYGLGQPLAILPLEYGAERLARYEHWQYGAAVLWFDRLVSQIFAALEVSLFLLFAVQLRYGVRRSLILTGIFGLATSVWPDGESGLEHTEIAFFLLLSFYLAYRSLEQDGGWMSLASSGVALGCVAITRYPDAIIGGFALGMYLVSSSYLPHRSGTLIRRLMALIAGVAPFVALDLWYDWFRFGSILATGHHEALFGNPILLGLLGLLASPGKGYLWYSPTILLLAIAAPAFAKKHPSLSMAILTLFAGFVAFYARVRFWHGDPTWGPRYIYPTLPFLTLPLGELLRPGARLTRLTWGVVGLVLATGLTIQVASVSVSQWRSWYKVITYEEARGLPWRWSGYRYRYFWDPHESPLKYQLQGFYQLAVDTLHHSHRYELVPPDEDPVLEALVNEDAVNSWTFWWTFDEFNWWMGRPKVVLGVVALVSVLLATLGYIASVMGGLFTMNGARSGPATRRTFAGTRAPPARLIVLTIIVGLLGLAATASTLAAVPGAAPPSSIYDTFARASSTDESWHAHATGAVASVYGSILTLKGHSVELDRRLQLDPYQTMVVAKVRVHRAHRFALGLGVYHAGTVTLELDNDRAGCGLGTNSGYKVDVMKWWRSPPTARWLYLALELTNPYYRPGHSVNLKCSIYSGDGHLLAKITPYEPGANTHYGDLDQAFLRTWDSGNLYDVDWFYAGPASRSPIKRIPGNAPH